MQKAGITLVFLFVITMAVAQRPTVRAQEEMELFHYHNAIHILKKELHHTSGKPDSTVFSLLARCYMAMNLPDSALLFFEKAPGHDTTASAGFDDTQSYQYAEALRMCGNYSQAGAWFRRCIARKSNIPDITRKLAACDSAMVWLKRPASYKVQPLNSLNSPQSEFGITPYDSGVVFTSDRFHPDKQEKKYAWTGNAYLSLYQATRTEDHSSGAWRSAALMTFQKKFGLHEGPVAFNRAGDMAYINRSMAANGNPTTATGSIQTGLLKIYISEKKQGEWTLPVPFFLNNDEWSVGHPALSITGDTLYFISDMPGGKGETDIYYCIRKEGIWSQPISAGDQINTTGREMFPCPGVNGNLYFSSDGLIGFGGLDLFEGIAGTDTVYKPLNMGHPLNSSRDDFAISTKDGLSGFISSDRPGGMGSDDMYIFSRNQFRDTLPATNIAVQIEAEVASSQTEQKVPDSLVPGKTYRLDNIHYDFDRWEIRSDAIPSLDNLVRIMKENPVTIELSSHTDCRGSHEYNLELSEKRAASAVEYLAAHGIDRSRMVASGYGETHLLNACDCIIRTDCPETEHQENRRTEFKITGINFNPD